ncbi:probable beta-D-xylosidase 7 isoform X1 [Cygnus olor]|uniref:probable beta-D-xylosidase 7 isoform X1 n=1 Tax=Cygnus olor TaxID=8869 RepID=UPI001ADDE84E|nr:probable beta-D-xylosidase 7 isoform X1 [Cygnus olor]
MACRAASPGTAAPGAPFLLRPGPARPRAALMGLGAAAVLLCAVLGPEPSEAQPFPFRDPTLPWRRRLEDLLGRLSPDEMVLQVARGGAMGNGPAPPIPRLGIGPYNWNTECLRGDAEAPGWATAFPQALGLAAAFSPELVYRVANATATEVRAKHNHFAATGRYDDHTGLSCFSPVLNIMRHPLWGRNQETYGEDPFLSGELAASFVRGLQGRHPRYIKASAGCKHFSVHGGPENIPVSRLSFDAKVLERDWRTTFLPQFQACVRAGSYSFMCSYNRINGVPACANKKLLTDILRGEWGFEGYVVSDEGAVELIMLGHRYTRTFLETAVASVNAGCNLELSYGMRNNVFMHIPQALAMGNITLETLRARVRPLFYTRLRLGEFDPPAMNPYSALDLGVVQSPEHRNLSLEAAVKSFVLLKNQRDTLPLRARDLPGKRLAVVGPFADNPRVLFGDYAPVPEPRYIYTPRRGLQMLPANVSFAAGCRQPRCQQYSRAEVEDAVRGADVVLVCLGTGIDVETEAKDRRDLALPGHQLELLQDAVRAAAGRPVILLLFNAGPLDVSWAQAHDGVGAILACFFPAQATGLAIARVLLGEQGANPAGRLPATWPAGMHQVRAGQAAPRSPRWSRGGCGVPPFSLHQTAPLPAGAPHGELHHGGADVPLLRAGGPALPLRVRPVLHHLPVPGPGAEPPGAAHLRQPLRVRGAGEHGAAGRRGGGAAVPAVGAAVGAGAPLAAGGLPPRGRAGRPGDQAVLRGAGRPARRLDAALAPGARHLHPLRRWAAAGPADEGAFGGAERAVQHQRGRTAAARVLGAGRGTGTGPGHGEQGEGGGCLDTGSTALCLTIKCPALLQEAVSGQDGSLPCAAWWCHPQRTLTAVQSPP